MTEKSSGPGPGHYKGWLWKWTNYVKGYQKRWFVLSNGLLSYYKSQAEVSVACRGTVILAGASIVTEDSCHFTISNGSAHRYHLKASSEVERQRWITALELAKSLSSKMMDSEESSDGESSPPTSARKSESGTDLSNNSNTRLKELAYISGQDQSQENDKKEIKGSLTPLEVKLADLETCNNLIGKHGTSLLSALADLEVIEKQKSSGLSSSSLAKLKTVNERAMLFRITSSAMISACTEFFQVAKSQSKKWQKMLTHEKEQRLRLEETVETLAKQHNTLERALNAGTGPPRSGSAPQSASASKLSDSDDRGIPEGLNMGPMTTPYETLSDDGSDDDEFVDAFEEAFLEEDEREESPRQNDSGSTSSSHESTPPSPEPESKDSPEPIEEGSLKIVHRTRVPFKPNHKLNLWSIMKNCIGRDLSRIPMPINFNEPISMLQRLTEDLEYHEILDRAAKCTDSREQMAHIAAFSVSSYSTTLFRIGKPFNPLLGETYELDLSEEKGFRSFCEQVSHHPPCAAMHSESTKNDEHGGWSFWQEVSVASKFRGKYMSITPLGTCHLKFHRTGYHYTWNKVTITIHNIIVGKLWVDQSGDSNFVNHVTGDKCKITFYPYSYFSRDIPRRVSGTVVDKDGNEHFHVFGTWDSSMKCKKTSKTVPKSQQETIILWQKYPLPPLAEKMYYFTKMALILNEWVDGTAPTDSRRRPDQKKMEEADWDEANKIKVELEDKQRFRRKIREAEQASRKESGLPIEPYKPRWFRKTQCPLTDEYSFVFTNEYWRAKERQEWTGIIDIFGTSDKQQQQSSSPTSSTVKENKAEVAKSASDGRLTLSFTKNQPKHSESSATLGEKA